MSAEPISDEPMTWPVSEYYVDSAGVATYTVETPHGTLYVKDRAFAEDIAAIPMWKRIAEQQNARGRLVPITRADPAGERSDYAVLVSMAQLLEESLAVQRHLLAAFSAMADGAGVAPQSTGGDSVSSVAIEDLAKGDPKITTKLYPTSPLTPEDVELALQHHAYAHRRAAELAMNGWAVTLASVRNEATS